MKKMRRLDAATVAETVAKARSGGRGRCNHNLHPTLADPVQRFLNALQPGSYVRPHRHDGHRWELFLLLEGEAAAVAFDEDGTITETVLLCHGGTRAVEFPGGVWHTVLALAPDTLLFEVKPGPYTPVSDKDFAAWAPREGETGGAALLAEWTALVRGAAAQAAAPPTA
jgi:cupin fold WbuC family metalloprotein